MDTNNPAENAERELRQQFSILVVDDEPGMVSFLQRALTRRYGKVDVADSVEAATPLFAAFVALETQYRGTLESISSLQAVMPPLTLLRYLKPCCRRKFSAFPDRESSRLAAHRYTKVLEKLQTVVFCDVLRTGTVRAPKP